MFLIIIIFLIIILIMMISLIKMIITPLSAPLWAQLQTCRHCSAPQISSCNPDHRYDHDDDNDDDNDYDNDYDNDDDNDYDNDYDNDGDDDDKKYLSPGDNRACSDRLLRKSYRINCTWVINDHHLLLVIIVMGMKIKKCPYRGN